MENYNNQSLYLLDKDFLIAITQQQSHDIYARITALDLKDNPIERIEGRVTGGNVSIDGSSSVRRTCNLTMVSQDVNINDYYWGIKTKFTLEIGLYNYLTGKYAFVPSGDYPEIVWFPQGYFLISSFNTSFSTNSYTISLSGKDKMCLLNGDLGGQLYASVDFGAEDIIADEMQEVLVPNIVNSDQLLKSDYYIKIESSNNAIYDYETDYVFIPNSEGNFYKDENKYIIYQESTSDDKKQRYNVYAKNQQASQYFKLCTNENNETTIVYKPNKYYLLNETSGVYALSTQKSISAQFYQLVPLYVRLSNLTKKKIPIEKIIREAVHTYAQESYHNIIINDLDEYGLEQLTYKGDQPLYLLYNEDSNNIIQIFQNDITQGIDGFVFYILNPSMTNSTVATKIKTNGTGWEESDNNEGYYVIKIEYGMDIGYRLTDLTYAGDLISNIGDSLTSVLDKIKTMLSDFEYFYDINGRFVFQKKKTYVNSYWSQISKTENETYVNYLNSSDKFSFYLNDNLLVSTIQNSPTLNNVRNDFVVWGKRKSLGQELPIHVRFAIDKKPVYYRGLDGKIYITKDYDEYYERDKRLEHYGRSGSSGVSFIKQALIENKNTIQGWWNLKSWIDFCKEKLFQDIDQDILVKTLLSTSLPSDLTTFFKEAELGTINASLRSPIFAVKNTIDNSINNTLYGVGDNLTIIDCLNDTGFEYYIYITFYNVDWREIIYQMALDYFKGQGCSKEHPIKIGNNTMTTPDDFLYYVGMQNPKYYPTGYTGYEQYYTDMQGFWRQLYNPDYFPEITYISGRYISDDDNSNTTENDNTSKIKEYNIEYYFNKDILNSLSDQDEKISELKNEPYALSSDSSLLSRLYWNRNVFEDPSLLNFWIDFLDSDSELAQFSIPQIGDRTKVVNDNSKSTSIIHPEVPNVLISYAQKQEETNESEEQEENNTEQQTIDFLPGYTSIQIPKGYAQYFDISHRSKSLQNQIDELLYQHGYCVENITISSVPIYFLEPNSLIFVYDENTKINGEYIVNRISIPLTYNGLMSINAIKAPSRII